MEKIVYERVSGGVCAAKGFMAAGHAAGIKASGAEDIALIYSEKPAKAACVFTTNKMAAAPVILSRKNIEEGIVSAAIVNSGNANACTGEAGFRDAETMAKETAKALGIDEKNVIVASTGIIGVPLPMDKITAGIAELAKTVKAGGNESAVKAIMTTDTYPKELAINFEFRGKLVTIGGIAKGSGMIAPNMATMLAFITTDINICRTCLKAALSEAVQESFNKITVDGECSTNDMVLIMASGEAGNEKLVLGDPDFPIFLAALKHVATELAKLIVKDGEGITKFIEIEAAGAKDDIQAALAAKAIANSLLVKTAFFGEDANWGRMVAAIGHSGADLDSQKIDLKIAGIDIVKGGVSAGFDEGEVAPALKDNEIKVFVDLGLGEGRAIVWTCDLSYDYVKINADYRT